MTGFCWHHGLYVISVEKHVSSVHMPMITLVRSGHGFKYIMSLVLIV
jgi:hypothetical protein